MTGVETKLTGQEKETLQKYLKESEETPPLTETVEKELIRRSKEETKRQKKVSESQFEISSLYCKKLC